MGKRVCDEDCPRPRGIAVVFYILIGIFSLGLLVLIHEVGHFLAGKAFDVRVEEFMLGLPSPKILKFKWGETYYGVTVLPLGGYVKFAGMDPTEELEPQDEARGFDAQAGWKRFLILAAGPAANLILATIIFAGVFMYGLPAPTTTIGVILKGYPAAKIGLQAGDTIVRIDGKRVASWDGLIKIIHASPKRQVELTVKRGGATSTFDPTLTVREGKGFLGIGPKLVDKGFGFFQSIWLGIKTTGLIVVAVVGFLIELPRQLGLLKQARGPVGLVQESAMAARNGFRDFIWLLGAFSVSLGVFNLIPMPPLDGGKVLLATVEGLTRKKMNKNLILAISAVGASLLVLLMVYVVVADIGRLLPSSAGG